jgi:outer membrane receptor protein involved in Fe transport
MRMYLLFLSLFFCSITFAQNSISGTVTESNSQSIFGANVKIVGESTGVVTDIDGNFTLVTSKKPPFVIEVTSISFVSKRVNVKSTTQKLNVTLEEEQTLLNEVVVSASRTPERVLESPVTIERMGIADIKKSTAVSFYDGLENLKEVQMNTSSLSFKSVNTRGFATVANTRFMQLVDGMDNSSPLLNFVLGNLIGLSEIDVQSVELLPGASSALYGANAFNGVLFMTSKSPFTSQGITSYVKFGQTSQKAAGVNDYLDYGIRGTYAFTPNLVAKANYTQMRATEWHATNYDDKTVVGRDRSHVNYNGINVYGDEVTTNIKNVGVALADLGFIPETAIDLLPDYNVSRTGYNEVDLTDNKASSTKVDFSLHYKPFGDDLEFIWQSKYGFGNAVYQGVNRYYLNNFFMQQHKLEVRGDNFFARVYTTTEDGGDSYDMIFTAINVNRQWKDDRTWYGQYAGSYITATLAGQNEENAHIAARKTADEGRFIPGTAEFNAAFDKVTADPDILTGSKLVDNSKIYHSDVNYNFQDIIDFADIQVGGSIREYQLNSFGRIYTDKDGPILYSEYGMYTQVQKKFFDDRLKFTGSMRYDKAQNFVGNVSPRVSLVYSGGESRRHNFRGSFQTGFRNPTTQDQYIGFNIGPAVLVGSAPDNLTRFSEVRGNNVNGSGTITPFGQAVLGSNTVVMNGENAYFNSYTLATVNDFAATGNAALLKRTDVDLVKPEQVKAFEVGYRSLISDISVDINGYYNIYNDFIGNLTVAAPYYGTAQDAPNDTPNPEDPGFQTIKALKGGDFRVYQLYTNTDLEIQSIGFGIGLSTKIYRDFEVGVNYNYAEFKFDQAKEPDFEAGFNTPKHKVKASFGNEKLFKNFGFNVSARYNTAYLWQSTFVDGMIAEATVIDAQVNYEVESLNSTFKIGASNIGGREYGQVLGAGLIGQQVFASWTINPSY